MGGRCVDDLLRRAEREVAELKRLSRALLMKIRRGDG